MNQAVEQHAAGFYKMPREEKRVEKKLKNKEKRKAKRRAAKIKALGLVKLKQDEKEEAALARPTTTYDAATSSSYGFQPINAAPPHQQETSTVPYKTSQWNHFIYSQNK